MTTDQRKQRQSRRRFLIGAGAALGAVPILDGQPAALGTLDETTIALVNGRIQTMDAGSTVANTISVRHNRIVAVGGAAPKAGRGVRIIDLKGRTVVPGLVEPHIHIVSLGNRPGYHTILENTTSIRERLCAAQPVLPGLPESSMDHVDGGLD